MREAISIYGRRAVFLFYKIAVCLFLSVIAAVGIFMSSSGMKAAEVRKTQEEQKQEEQKEVNTRGFCFQEENLSYRVMFPAREKQAGQVIVTGLNEKTAKVEIPETILYKEKYIYQVTAIAREAFAKDAVIRSIYIPASVNGIGGAFLEGCSNLEKITVSENSEKYKTVDNVLYTKSGKTLLALIETGAYYLIPRGVIQVAEGAFVYCPSLKTVIFPQTLKKVKVQFKNSCPKLEEVIFRGTVPPSAENGRLTKPCSLDQAHKKLVITVPEGMKRTYQTYLDTMFTKKEGLPVREDPNTEKKKVYLTFDDGPDVYTDTILNYLEKYNAKASFFVIGKTDANSQELYRKITQQRHTLAVHSTSHNYKTIYAGLTELKADYLKTRDIIWKATGIKPVLYRFPGGSSNRYCKDGRLDTYIRYLNELGVIYFDWNISAEDASGKVLTAEQIAYNVIDGVRRCKSDVPVVLLHDTHTKKNTVDALPVILDTLTKEGYSMEALDEYVTPVQHRTLQNSPK